MAGKIYEGSFGGGTRRHHTALLTALAAAEGAKYADDTALAHDKDGHTQVARKQNGNEGHERGWQERQGEGEQGGNQRLGSQPAGAGRRNLRSYIPPLNKCKA